MLKKIFNNLEEYLCAVMLFFIAALAFANVLVRYLTNGSLAFTEELIINLFVWITVFGASIAFKKRAHLGVTLLTSKFPPQYQKAVAVFSALCSIALFGILFDQGKDMVIMNFKNQMTTYSIGLPMWWFSMAVPVGALLLIVRVVQATLVELKTLDIVEE